MKLMKPILAGLLIAVMLSTSGCALMWLGAGAGGGYLIRKGEEGGGTSPSSNSSGATKKKTASETY